MTSRTLGLLVSAVTLLASAAALADPPGRVGRLDYVDGTVWFENQDAPAWEPANLNYPVTTGANFWSGDNSRAEIQVGPAALRLAPDTVVGFARLDDGATQIRVSQGSVNVTTQAIDPGPIQFITPSGEIDVMSAGKFRVDAGTADGSQPARVVVFSGQAQVDGASGAVPVAAGQSATLANQQVAEAQGAPQIAIDDWAAQRDAALAPPPQVPATMTGYQDLAGNGNWSTDPSYGAVWYPTAVPSDWAPYRYGHWAYVAPWGWTWIDDARWGFAPFHYGRWAQFRGRWGWVPGPVAVRPVYAPALVAFIGGPGFSLAITSGPADVGWVPLAPAEVYIPTFAVSAGYVQRVNARAFVPRDRLANVDALRNQAVVASSLRNRGAVTAVARADFVASHPVNRATVAVAGARLQQAHVVTTQAQVAQIAPAPARAARTPGAATPAGERTQPNPPAERRAAAAAGGAATPAAARTGLNRTFTPPSQIHRATAAPAGVTVAPANSPAAAAVTAAPGAVRPQGARPEAARPEGARAAVQAAPATAAPAATPATPGAAPAAAPATTPAARAEERRGEAGRPGAVNPAASPNERRAEQARPPAAAATPAATPAAPATPATPATPAARPEAVRPEVARPVIPTPATPQAVRPEAARPEAARPEAARPETTRPEAVRPAAPAAVPAIRPEVARPEVARPATPVAPQVARPEVARPEVARPEVARPQAVPQVARPVEPVRPAAPAPAARPVEPARPAPAPVARPVEPPHAAPAPAAAPHPAPAAPAAVPEKKKEPGQP